MSEPHSYCVVNSIALVDCPRCVACDQTHGLSAMLRANEKPKHINGMAACIMEGWGSVPSRTRSKFVKYKASTANSSCQGKRPIKNQLYSTAFQSKMRKMVSRWLIFRVRFVYNMFAPPAPLAHLSPLKFLVTENLTIKKPSRARG